MNFPITLDVSPNGSVSIDHADGIVAMSRFSERAQRLAAWFGTGSHVLADPTDLDVDLLADLNAAVA